MLFLVNKKENGDNVSIVVYKILNCFNPVAVFKNILLPFPLNLYK